MICYNINQIERDVAFGGIEQLCLLAGDSCCGHSGIELFLFGVPKAWRYYGDFLVRESLGRLLQNMYRFQVLLLGLFAPKGA